MTDAAQPIRSPSYPGVSLAEALDSVRKIEQGYRTSKVDRVVAAKLIGYSSLSGAAAKALASLAQYGLVERAGKGELRVAERALGILHPDTAQEKEANLRLAAFEPPLFRELQERYPNIVPPEDGIITYLNRKGFNQSAIRPAVKAYLQTLQYLKEAVAIDRGIVGKTNEIVAEQNDSKDGAKFGGARVGDLIQWEVDGVLQPEAPMRVRLVTPDGNWVAVEGSETGLPMEQVIVQKRALESPVDAPRFPIEPVHQSIQIEPTSVPEGWKEERLIDDGGEEIFIRYRGEPTAERYTYIRDYLDFKLSRIKKDSIFE